MCLSERFSVVRVYIGHAIRTYSDILMQIHVDVFVCVCINTCAGLCTPAVNEHEEMVLDEYTQTQTNVSMHICMHSCMAFDAYKSKPVRA